MRRRAFLGAVGASMAGLAGCMGQPEYNLSNFSAKGASGPLEFDATLDGGGITVDSSGTLTLTLTNTQSNPITIKSRTFWPFGVPRLSLSEDDREQEFGDTNTTRDNGFDSFYDVLPVRNKYENSEAINVSAINEPRSIDLEFTEKAIQPDKTITREYEIGGRGITFDGTYELYGFESKSLFEYDAGNGFEPFEPSVTLEIERKQLIPFI
ncbi:hypothetical protein [Halocatena halophila]|uniref:hypothetical protein n=1 Tax=Halocatena halophila TaxID=2814576 RepID=UPI002ECFE904